MTRRLLTRHALARTLDVDARTVLRLVALQVIAPDYRAGDRQLYWSDRVPHIRSVLKSCLGVPK